MSNLVNHAKTELAKTDFDTDNYDGLISLSVLQLVSLFSRQGHSGNSAALTIDLFRRLASFDVLSPITSDKEEWGMVASYTSEGTALWQSKRRPSTFSRDGGKTWYDIEDDSRSNGDTWKRAE